MIELNNIRLSLGLSWNEFYLCFLIHEKSGHDGICPLSRNDISENIGLSTRAIIELVKKIESIGYMQNVAGKLKATGKWISAVEEARAFVGQGSEETSLEPVQSATEATKSEETSGEETSPSAQKNEETSPAIQSIVKKLHHDHYAEGEETSLSENPEVKKLHHYTNDSEETSPANQEEVKKLPRQNEENIEQNSESEESSPEETSPGDLYILNNNINNISKGEIDIEKGCGEKQKSSPFEITTDSIGVATCQVLRRACLEYDAAHPGLYPADMYKKFIGHWSALKSGKPAWYREKTRTKGTWDLPLRLSQWHQRDLNFNSKTYNGKSNQRGGSSLRPTSIAEPSHRIGPGNVAHVEF